MLYGVRPEEQRRLAAQGETVRVYVPYGDEWYGYLVRRLAERPANARRIRSSGSARSALSWLPHSVRRTGAMTVAIFGAGVMGETLLSGLLRSGRRPRTWWSASGGRSAPPSSRERYGVEVVEQRRGGGQADTVVLVVKPQDMGDAARRDRARDCAGHARGSLAAGITTAFIEQRLPDGTPWCGSCRTRRRSSTRAWPRSRPARTATRSTCEAEGLMRAVGRVMRVPEKQQDAVTAICGSGPAYLFFVVESMIEAGVHLGLPRATATELVVQTMSAPPSCCARPVSTRRCCASR